MTLDNSIGNGIDFFTDQTFPDQVGKHPIRSLYRYIVHGFPDFIIGKGNITLFALGKILFHLLQRITGFKFGFSHRLQQVIIGRKAAQHHIGQRYPVLGVNIAESSLVSIRL